MGIVREADSLAIYVAICAHAAIVAALETGMRIIQVLPTDII